VKAVAPLGVEIAAPWGSSGTTKEGSEGVRWDENGLALASFKWALTSSRGHRGRLAPYAGPLRHIMRFERDCSQRSLLRIRYECKLKEDRGASGAG
jgi:hypothetical protein